MAPSLQGLNIVHPPHTASSGQDLLSGPPFPDLLWNNLVFEDESPDDKFNSHQSRGADDDLDLDNAPQSPASLLHLGHVNVVTGTNAPEAPPVQQPQPFDLNNLLATFTQPPPGISPSIVQLLALHSVVQNAVPSTQQQQQQQRQSPSTVPRSAPFDVPPTKRARTRKMSISSAADTPEDVVASVAEDKRRRNTAASARFRLKKKEREAALETRAKELETRVNELERECEGLRRENGWLKGLVVGVTGAVQQAPQPTSSLKRGRDELEAA